MKYKTALISLLVVLFLSAFIQNPRPLFALPLPEGRTYDQAHDSGFIDWSGAVGYVYLHHKDNTSLPPEEGGTFCGNPGGCWEWVTRISNGGTVSGSFAPVGVAYFEVMVVFTHNSGAGTAILNACGSLAAWDLYVGPGSGLPGFVSMSVPVPAGCTSWSLSASGGYVDFRSVDANYVSPPPPVSTNTFTPIPTETFTPSPTATGTPVPTETFTPSPTATETLTPTATETLAPGVTPSDTPTDTPLPTSTVLSTSTSTSTPSQTLPPGVTPSNTPVPSNTPLPPIWTNTPKPLPSNGGQGGNPPVVPFVAFPTATPTRSLAVVVPTVAVRTPTPQIYSVVALPSLPVCGTPSSPTASASGEANFPWWLLPAGMSLASALSLLNSFLKQSGSGKVASLAPSGVAVPVPKIIQRRTTVGEWVTRPIRTLVQITRTIFRTIVEAIPRFITVTRQVIDRIVHSEWVTTFRQVAKTFWETVTEKVPLLGFLGAVIGFIWKTFVKPVIRWVTEAIRTLRTWVENVVRWVVERIQDGWNYITRQIAETVREWVEKVEWIREWVTKEIVVPEVVWETKIIPLPSLNDPANVRRLLQLVGTAGLGAISLSMCGTPTSTPAVPTPDIQATAACLALTMQADATQTAQAAFTPTLAPTATLAPFVLPSTTYVVGSNETDCQAIAAKNGISLAQLYEANPTIKSNDPNVCYIREGLMLTIPEQPIRTPGENVGLYDCDDTPPKVCLSPNDSADVMLTHILFGEGGSTIGASAAANEMYVLTNRANQILRQRGIDPFSLTDEQYKQFLVQVASQTYYDGEGNAYPAFNAFDAPVEHPREGEYGYENWNSATLIANTAIASRGQTWIFDTRNDSDILNDAVGKPVIAYCAPAPGSPDPNSLPNKVYFDARDYNPATNQYQFYFNYQQFYNGGGKEYCEQYANYR